MSTPTNPKELQLLRAIIERGERVYGNAKCSRKLIAELGVPARQAYSWMVHKWAGRWGYDYGSHPFGGWFPCESIEHVRDFIDQQGG